MFDKEPGMALNLTESASLDQPEREPEISPLIELGTWFASIHGYASLIVCLFGICTNIFNITVLARKDMRSPTNALLTWLAVSDILTMIPYVPFVIHFYCAYKPEDVSPEKYSYTWVIYMLFLVNFAATTHTVSIWLGVSLAVFRVVQLRSTTKGIIARKRRYAQIKKVIALVYILSALVLIPNYLTNKVDEVTLPDNTTLYVIKDLKLATNETEPIVLANVITYAVVAKLIPCVLMIIFSGSLLISLNLKGRKRRRRLSTISNNCRRENRQAKTTRMLLVVIILFLVTEFPQGLLIVLSSTVKDFYMNVYIPLGDLMDFFALINNAINFVLYCIMSTQFRTKFLQMYLNRRLPLKSLEKINLTTSLNRTTLTSTG